jgi:hypothetical protein
MSEMDRDATWMLEAMEFTTFLAFPVLLIAALMWWSAACLRCAAVVLTANTIAAEARRMLA